jgi:phosphate starvation-inducible protein PhoH
MQLRFWVFDGNELIRKLASEIEAQPYVDAGCTLTVLPKIKEEKVDQYQRAMRLVGECLV